MSSSCDLWDPQSELYRQVTAEYTNPPPESGADWPARAVLQEQHHELLTDVIRIRSILKAIHNSPTRSVEDVGNQLERRGQTIRKHIANTGLTLGDVRNVDNSPEDLIQMSERVQKRAKVVLETMSKLSAQYAG